MPKLENFNGSLLCHVSSNQVLETTHQVGRISISTTTDVVPPFKEMAQHCELLLMGKQQKMSSLMCSQQKQETVMLVSLQNQENEVNPRHEPNYVSILDHM